MRRTLTLRYPATCAECGAELAAGDRARYYGPYRVYGIDCHARTDPATRPSRSGDCDGTLDWNLLAYQEDQQS